MMTTIALDDSFISAATKTTIASIQVDSFIHEDRCDESANSTPSYNHLRYFHSTAMEKFNHPSATASKSMTTATHSGSYDDKCTLS